VEARVVASYRILFRSNGTAKVVFTATQRGTARACRERAEAWLLRTRLLIEADGLTPEREREEQDESQKVATKLDECKLPWKSCRG